MFMTIILVPRSSEATSKGIKFRVPVFLTTVQVRMTDMKGSTSNDSDICAMHKEWDDASCPICMDHPHNAVLLLCSSHDKGCRSYICDTSYRHSNCLDRLKKLRSSEQRNEQTAQPGPSFTGTPEGESPAQRSFISATSEPIFRGPRRRRSFAETHEAYSYQENNVGIASGLLAAVEENNDGEDSDRYSHSRNAISGAEEMGDGCTLESNSNLKCPLCRGTVRGWKIVKEARQYLDLKQRSCSRESCSFSGNYRELRRHARRVHPTTRPADVDPSRQRAWRHLEHQREYGDIVVTWVMMFQFLGGDEGSHGPDQMKISHDVLLSCTVAARNG
ncbi:hypothetical protein H6P81_013783 [Aristolochia fimbriata]|uniref:Uncharacterized protein n=1 Tax=Aristolochia fimbriata TaxID=158543 RepID=A0AAV7EHV2_ARIFI|nr:hypothetical protein H6P81_013783 [Aristolochia fimbriata]